MNLKSLSLVAVFAVALAVTLPLWAHHSHGNYAMETYTELKGTVQEVHWLNPHTWVYLEVKEGDKTTMWAMEGASPPALRSGGWTTDMIKAGDTISARCHRLKDGSPGCLLGFITIKDGVERKFD
jgi:Family of unknown function (DUF6152)